MGQSLANNYPDTNTTAAHALFREWSNRALVRVKMIRPEAGGRTRGDRSTGAPSR
jgi:hypothetical protein